MADTKKDEVTVISPAMEKDQWLYFPEEIIFEILVRLPANLVRDLRCVSKAWSKLIRNPVFIETHLRRSGSLLLIKDEFKPDIRFIAMKEGKISVEYSSLFCKGEIISSSNGLLLMGDTQGNGVFIANPVTKQLETLPLVSFLEHGHSFTPVAGLRKVVIFRTDKLSDRYFHFYAYDFNLQQMRSMNVKFREGKCLPYINSLAWWKYIN